jgi:glucosamine--fructose-6-phosphate aminotransferase (isomerizing)
LNLEKRSMMADEARAASEAVARQLDQDEPSYRKLGARLRSAPPPCVVTVARGSSDHAASYFAYLVMSQIGHPVASLPPSVVTLYSAPLKMAGGLALGVSQSGESPDVVNTIAACRAERAVTVAMVNTPDSPLANAAEWTLPLHAGPERSVAATKSFVASLSAMARMVAHWRRNEGLLEALRALPAALDAACESQVHPLVDALTSAPRLLVLGRGPGFSIALEAALKFKETCAIHAEAFTEAEVRHGPMALIEAEFPLLVFAPRGPAQAGLASLAHEFRARGARVILVGPPGLPGVNLVVSEAPHELLDPLCQIQAFYLAAATLAKERGLDPDAPRSLQKVTKTL